jgi:hypothetical protein
MASGFLVLIDGRCFAKRWSGYDDVLRKVTDHIDAQAPLKAWLLSQLPGPRDVADVGYGPGVRASDSALVPRFLDLRELTPENQSLFSDAVLRASELASDSGSGDFMRQLLLELANMVARQRRGEPPLSRSDWREVVPSKGEESALAGRLPNTSLERTRGR